MLLSWINTFQLLIALLSVLLAVYVRSTRRCEALVVFLAALALHNLLRLAADNTGQAVLEAIGNCMRFIYAPLVYFAARELLYQEFRYRWQHLLHLLPLAVALGITLWAPGLSWLLGPAVGALVIAYLAAAYRVVWRFRLIIAQTRSSGPPVGLAWLQRTLHTYAALVVFEVLRLALGAVIPDATNSLTHMLFLVVVCALLSYLVLQGMRRPALLPAIAREEEAIASPPLQRSARQVDSSLRARLEAYMREQKPYLNPQLTVSELAHAMDVPSRSLSEVINDLYDCNFSEYINRARVEEARALISDPAMADRSLLDIGLAAGFNSKTSFNVMFKRHAGTTPSAYRRDDSQQAVS